MKYYVLNLRTFKTVTASSKSEAERLGNGSIIFGSAEELARDQNTTGQILCRAYNEMSPVQIDRFADKVSGAKRLFKLVHSSAPKNEFNFDKSVEELAVDSRPDEMELYREKVLKDTSTPKKSKYAGKTITCLVDENPRRENKKPVCGYASMKILIENKKMSFEDYIEKGGRLQDLDWDLNKGWVSVE
jgi:hypothetical protein|tara:strand:- start:23084 stop:23647 length:564 start_codon:yes stop_codon:yes gene_type:complete